MDDFLISIIVHIYNSEECLNECLNSIINQTYNNLEIICINDGSTDGSLKMLKEYKQKDNRIKIINIKNRGISFSRNIGIKESIGKFIVFVDGNDYINLEFCENLLNNQKKSYADLVCGKKDELEQKLSTIDNKDNLEIIFHIKYEACYFPLEIFPNPYSKTALKIMGKLSTNM